MVRVVVIVWCVNAVVVLETCHVGNITDSTFFFLCLQLFYF